MRHKLLIVTALVIQILIGSETDIFVPGFPELCTFFSVSPFKIELTIGANLLAYCVSAIVIGVFGDRYSRKSVIIWGLIIFIIGTVICIQANNYLCLIIGRIVQGIGAALPSVVGYLLIADMYPLDEQREIMGWMNGFTTLAACFAPVVGAFVNIYYGWRGSFWVLLGMSLLSLFLSILLDSRYKKAQNKEQGSNIMQTAQNDSGLKQYIKPLLSKKILLYSGIILFIIAPYCTFVAIIPILYVKDMGLSLQEFGIYQGSVCFAFSMASIFTGALLKRYTPSQLGNFSIALISLSGIFIVMLLINTAWQSPLYITILLNILGIPEAFLINIVWPLVLAADEKAKAKITSMLLSGRLILTSAMIQVVTYFYRGNFFSLGVAMFFSLIMVIIFYVQLKRFKPDSI